MLCSRWFRFIVLSTGAIVLSVSVLAHADEAAGVGPLIKVYKSPTCGCCTKWAEHLRENGFSVKMVELSSLEKLKRDKSVPARSRSCHTATVDEYVIEGHVPASDIKRLLHERPAVLGLVVPGMPLGSPGMEFPRPQPYTVFTFDKSGRGAAFARHE